MIHPTVGRKVWYRPSEFDKSGPGGLITAGDQPLDATILAVWNDRMVNLLVVDVLGKLHPRLSVALVQDGDAVPAGGAYAEWMPYQQGQAKRHQEVSA